MKIEVIGSDTDASTYGFALVVGAQAARTKKLVTIKRDGVVYLARPSATGARVLINLGPECNLYDNALALSTRHLNVKSGSVDAGRQSDALKWPMLKDAKRFAAFVEAEGARSDIVRSAAAFAMTGTRGETPKLVVPRFSLLDGGVVEPDVAWVSLQVEPVEVRVVEGRSYALVRVVDFYTVNNADMVRKSYADYSNYGWKSYHSPTQAIPQSIGTPYRLRGLLFAVVDIAAYVASREHDRWKFDVTVDLPASGVVPIPLSVFDERFTLSVRYDAQTGTVTYTGNGVVSFHWLADKPMWVAIQRGDMKVSVVSEEGAPIRLRLVGRLDTGGRVLYTPLGGADGFVFDARTLNSVITGDDMQVISSVRSYTVPCTVVNEVAQAPWGLSGRAVFKGLGIRIYYGHLIAFHETTSSCTLSGTGGPTGAAVPSGAYALVDSRTTEDVTVSEYALNLYSIEFGDGLRITARKISVPVATSSFSATANDAGNWDAVMGASMQPTGRTVRESAADVAILALSRDGELSPVVAGHIPERYDAGLYIQTDSVRNPPVKALLGHPVPADRGETHADAGDEGSFITRYVGIACMAYAGKVALWFDLTSYWVGYEDVVASAVVGTMKVLIRGAEVHAGAVIDTSEYGVLMVPNPLTDAHRLTLVSSGREVRRDTTSSKHYVGDFGGLYLSGYGPVSSTWERDATTQHVGFVVEGSDADGLYGYQQMSLAQINPLRLGNLRLHILHDGVRDLLTVTLVDDEFARWSAMFGDYLAGRIVGGGAANDGAAWATAFENKSTPLMSSVYDTLRNSPAMSANLGYILVERDAETDAFWEHANAVRASVISREAAEKEKLGTTAALESFMAGVYVDAKSALRPLYMKVIFNEFDLSLDDIERLGFGGYVSGAEYPDPSILQGTP